MFVPFHGVFQMFFFSKQHIRLFLKWHWIKISRWLLPFTFIHTVQQNTFQTMMLCVRVNAVCWGAYFALCENGLCVVPSWPCEVRCAASPMSRIISANGTPISENETRCSPRPMCLLIGVSPEDVTRPRGTAKPWGRGVQPAIAHRVVALRFCEGTSSAIGRLAALYQKGTSSAWGFSRRVGFALLALATRLGDTKCRQRGDLRGGAPRCSPSSHLGSQGSGSPGIRPRRSLPNA